MFRFSDPISWLENQFVVVQDRSRARLNAAETQTQADIFKKKVVETQTEPEIGRTKMAETQTEMKMVKNEIVQPGTTLKVSAH